MKVKRGEKLITWLKDNGSTFPNLYFEYYAVDYRGVAINTDLATGSIILKVAPKCLLTIDKAKESPVGTAIIRSGCRLRSKLYVKTPLRLFSLSLSLSPQPRVDICAGTMR